MEPLHHHEIANLLTSDVSFSGAFIGAFFSFFSIWQFCIAQISPFFMAFIAGVYLIENNDAVKKSIISILIASLGYSAGFSIVFAMLGLSGSNIGGYFLYNIKVFRILSGILILLSGISIMSKGLDKTPIPFLPNRIFWFLAPFIGASFAFVYSPCIPPALSQILNYASMPENTAKGFWLLVVYGIGLSAAFISVGIPLSLFVGWLAHRIKQSHPFIIGSAVFLIVLGVMAITDLMIYYKAFLLSFFV
ncbi:MAG: hypothetical protein HY026_00385 [Deltaproteobacteria bacterium]|nr:hypothetical protein [Deltaproteobacteria bacterium]